MAFYNSTKTVKFITEILTVNEIENHYTTDPKALQKYFVGYSNCGKKPMTKFFRSSREIENYAYAKFWREKNKKYFGIFI